MTHRDHRQGVYIIRAGNLLYVGSVAGGTGRSFDARLAEHLRDLARSKHANDRLQAQYRRDAGHDWRMVIKVPTPRGNIGVARLVEKAIIRALGRSCCNERR